MRERHENPWRCQFPGARLYCDLRPATCDLRPATCDLRPATCDLRLATEGAHVSARPCVRAHVCGSGHVWGRVTAHTAHAADIVATNNQHFCIAPTSAVRS